jgi:hypothetical protein
VVNSRISPVQLGASVRKFNLNRPFICPILLRVFLLWLVGSLGLINRVFPTPLPKIKLHYLVSEQL